MGASSKRRGVSDPSNIPRGKVKQHRNKDKSNRDSSSNGQKDSSSGKSDKKLSRSASSATGNDKDRKTHSSHDRRYGTSSASGKGSQGLVHGSSPANQNYPNAKLNVGSNNNTNTASNTNTNSNSHNRKKVIDTSLLARGMTSRTIGIRVSNNIKPLSPSEVERDIRHMEAYGTACVSYAQQLFAFSNRELVTRGHFGPAPPAPGMTFSQPTNGNGSATGGSTAPGSVGSAGGISAHAQPSVTMPVRIDPEEEKRLALLRKRVAASEARREVLETEYLSLRAHYVHESHKLRRVRSAVTGQTKLLRDLVERKGMALAMRRVKCAVAREILHAFEIRGGGGEGKGGPARGGNLESKTEPSVSDEAGVGIGTKSADPVTDSDGTNASADPTTTTTSSDVNNTDDAQSDPKQDSAPQDNSSGHGNGSSNGPTPMEGIETPTLSPTPSSSHDNKDTIPADLVDIWSLVESKLHEAELACTEIDTPEDLSYIKNALRADAAALENATDTTINGFRRPRVALLAKESGGEEEDTNSVSVAGSAGTGGNREKDAKKKKSRSERAAKRNEDEDGAGRSGSYSNGNGSGSGEMDEDVNVIPWACRDMHRTPKGVALYLSNLSKSPELAAAFACDKLFGSKPQSLAWLESNLPASAEPGAQNDAENLRKIKEEVKMLSAELNKEVETNSKLHKAAFKGRKRSNEICAMMTMIRSETEALIQRHNQIIEMNEDEQMDAANAEAANTEAEEGEIEDDDDGDDIGIGNGGLDKLGEKNDRDGNGPVLEVIVPSQSDSDSRVGDSLTMTMDSKRGYANAEDGSDHPDKKRRKV